jgi:TolA-binding protein
MRSTSTAKFVLSLFAMSVAGPGWSTQAGRQPAPSAEIDRAWKLVEQGRATEAMKVANALLATMTPRDSWWSAAQLVSAVAAGAAGKYATAAIAFHKIYVEAPQSNEAPTALVGLAGAMFELVSRRLQHVATRCC